jgi:hypothetical protein
MAVSIGFLLLIGVVLVIVAGAVIAALVAFSRGSQQHPRVVGCPHCGRNVLPDVELCPSCGQRVK